MSGFSFIKMHGLGNDFVVLDLRERPIRLSAASARAIADRRRGVGCDQLIILEPSNKADLFMRIHNADGGEVSACGNATRCVGWLIMEETAKESATIETRAGLLHATRGDGPDMITVDMGKPGLDWRDIPLAREMDTLHMDLAWGPEDAPTLSDPVGVDMGNPHAVFFVDDAEAVDLETAGPALEHDPIFPERANIEVISKNADGSLRMRVWERGAGITQACGSGACAVIVAAKRRHLATGKTRIILDGGPLDMEWRDDGHVMMTGPVATSFTGTLDASLMPAEIRAEIRDAS